MTNTVWNVTAAVLLLEILFYLLFRSLVLLLLDRLRNLSIEILDRYIKERLKISQEYERVLSREKFPVA